MSRWIGNKETPPGNRPIDVGDDITQALWNVEDREPLLAVLREAGVDVKKACAQDWTLHSVQLFVTGEGGGRQRLMTHFQRETVHFDAVTANRWQSALRETGVIA